jgi:predicted SAM-dependent methyltransferase
VNKYFRTTKKVLRPLARQFSSVRSVSWSSETSKCRKRLAPFCQGFGVDLGFGGDSITEHAVRIDLPQPYTNVGQQPVQLGGDCSNLHWFRDEVLDFVYSSHLLEDFASVKDVLREWLRVLKVGGNLILYCPNERRFRAHCARTGQPLNPAHKHEDFSLEKVKAILAALGQTQFIYAQDEVEIYSWELVCRKS